MFKSYKSKKQNLLNEYYFIGIFVIILLLVVFQLLTLVDFNKSATQKFNTDIENAIADIRKDLKVEISFILGINPTSINWETDEAANIEILWSSLQNVSHSKIERIIANRLEEHGVKSDFEFRITGSNVFNSMNSSGYNSSMTSNSFQKALTYDGSFVLFLYIKNKAKIINKNIYINGFMMLIIIIAALLLFNRLRHSYNLIRSSNEAKTDFINNMTHELKTPLSTIALTVDFLQNPLILENKEKILENISIIKSENKRMTQQVEKILEAAQYQTSELEITKVPINVNILLNRFTSNFRHRLKADNQNIDLHLNASHEIILADEVHFANILNNLMDNAYKYSKPEYVQIDIYTSNPNANTIKIVIEDKGIGMKKEAVKQVFERFYRAPTGNLHNVKGFGLGLHYVKTVIDAHNADIQVETSVGVGTKFILIFPTHQV